MIDMKPRIEHSRLVGLQRTSSTALGAAVATPILLTVHNRDTLEVTIILLVAIGASKHGVNNAYDAAAIASNGPHRRRSAPAIQRHGSRDARVLFTFIGVGIGVTVMFIADRIQERSAGAAPTPAV